MNCEKTNKKEFRVEKVMKRKCDKLYVKRKGYIILLTIGLIRKDIVYMSEYFSEPKSFGRKVKVELDLYNYTTKAELENATGEYMKICKKG